MLNRFSNIFWHYYGGALLGFRQRLWPEEETHSSIWKGLAVALYLAQLSILLFVPLATLSRLGLALILFSPQWLYAAFPSHPIFEYRAYGMALGMALVLAQVFRSHPLFAVPVCVVWAWRSHVRHHILTQPLRFWKCAQEDNSHGSLL